MAWWAPYANFLVRIVLLAPLAYISWAVFPVYWANTQLEQYMEKVAMNAVVHGHSERLLLAGVLRKVRELELPVKESQIEVENDDNEVVIGAKYQVPVNLVATTVKLDFHPRAHIRKPKLSKEGMQEMQELTR